MLEEYQMIIKLVKVDQFGNKAVISFQNKTIEKLPIHNIVVNTKGRIQYHNALLFRSYIHTWQNGNKQLLFFYNFCLGEEINVLYSKSSLISSFLYLFLANNKPVPLYAYLRTCQYNEISLSLTGSFIQKVW